MIYDFLCCRMAGEMHNEIAGFVKNLVHMSIIGRFKYIINFLLDLDLGLGSLFYCCFSALF